MIDVVRRLAGFAAPAALAVGLLGAAEPRSEEEGSLDGVVDGILAAWERADLVCLGEDHGRRNDSDLRIALVGHPSFVSTVDVVVVEFANPVRQDVLDRLALDGEDVPPEELRRVWRDATGATVWESPLYEEFLRAVRRANLAVPRERRVRIVAGDSPIDWEAIDSGEELLPLLNRGRFMREIVSREVMDKRLKALAVYGSRHCERRGGGLPGELEDRYPGRFWVAFGLSGEDERAAARRRFDLGAKPRLVPVRGTPAASLPAGEIFPWAAWGRAEAKLGDLLDAFVDYGDRPDAVVHPDPARLDDAFRRELERRDRLRSEAHELRRRGSGGP